MTGDALAFRAATLFALVAMLNATLITVFALANPWAAMVVGVGAPTVAIFALAVASSAVESTPATGGGESDSSNSTMTETDADGGIAAE